MHLPMACAEKIDIIYDRDMKAFISYTISHSAQITALAYERVCKPGGSFPFPLPCLLARATCAQDKGQK